ncbi:MAG: transcriptional repressor [Muribaculaceae bacterium]|nr:transcriptional repressor [Muribaculaceae bacterium]
MVRIPHDTNANSAVVKHFTAFLESKQLRKTPERFAILRRVLMFTRHFTIETLRQDLEQEAYHVSRATLYNTIDLLIEAGVIVRHVFNGQQPQYERATGLTHNHLVCTHCGKVKEVRDDGLIAFMNTRKYNAFNADRYSLTVYGMCSTCARKIKRQAAAQASKQNNQVKQHNTSGK